MFFLICLEYIIQTNQYKKSKLSKRRGDGDDVVRRTWCQMNAEVQYLSFNCYLRTVCLRISFITLLFCVRSFEIGGCLLCWRRKVLIGCNMRYYSFDSLPCSFGFRLHSEEGIRSRVLPQVRLLSLKCRARGFDLGSARTCVSRQELWRTSHHRERFLVTVGSDAKKWT